MDFEKDGYYVLRNGLSLELCKFIEIQYDLLRNNILEKSFENYDTEFKNKIINSVVPNNKRVNNTFSLYSTLFGEALLLHLQNVIEKIVGLELLPTYSYSRIYYNRSKLPRHKDRPSCEYSFSICIKNDKKPWTIWLENRNNGSIPIDLNEGDMLIYKGTELTHWRNVYEGSKQIQIFLHYVDKNGIHSDYVFDKRNRLYLNENYVDEKIDLVQNIINNSTKNSNDTIK